MIGQYLYCFHRFLCRKWQFMKKKTRILEEIGFSSPWAFRKWLSKNHNRSTEIWLRIFKKNSGVKSISYAEALEQALCFGWIDGQKSPFDEASWLQRFTPRRPRSGWSKKNTEHAERLIKSGAMTPSGLSQINAAKSDGRWNAAYDTFGSAAAPEDFLRELAKNKRALAFFKMLNKTNLYSIFYRLQTAKKPETRKKRMKAIIEMLEQGKTFH